MKFLTTTNGKNWEYVLILPMDTFDQYNWVKPHRALATAMHPKLIDYETGEVLATIDIEQDDIVARFTFSGELPDALAAQHERAKRIASVWRRTLSQFALFARALEYMK